MAKKKKISRKQLLKEPDEFITFTGRVINFAMAHKTQIAYSVATIVALLAIVSGYRFFAIRAENRVQALLQQAVAKYETAIKNENALKAYQAVSEDFQQILEKFGNKHAAKIARLTYANICFDAGKYEQAIELYTAALKDFENHAFIRNLILSGIGYAYEEMKDRPAAVAYFEKIAASNENVLGDEALFNLGVIYEKLGEKEKSGRAFNRLLTEYPDSNYIQLVKERPAG